MKQLLIMGALCWSACTAEAPPPVVTSPPPEPTLPEAAIVDVDPPLIAPAPVAITWAPPPLRIEVVTPEAFFGAVWIGGYWHWDGDWVWARGRWMAPPAPGLIWTVPYYENRDSAVVFVGGYWRAQGTVFVPPAPGIFIAPAVLRAGVVIGPRPFGPPGVFIPAPPGSRLGVIVPAPIGTHPGVVATAPPLVRPGMTVQANGGRISVVAPAGVTRNGHALHGELTPHPAFAAGAPHAAAPHVSAASVSATHPPNAHPAGPPRRAPGSSFHPAPQGHQAAPAKRGRRR